MRLDGGTIWDSGDKPVTDDKLTDRRAPVQAGPARAHAAPRGAARHEEEGQGHRQASATAREQTFAIVVPDGKRTTIALTGDEDGSLPDYEPRIELELESETLKK